MDWKSETLETADGTKLRLYTAGPVKPKAVIQINHGMAEHAARYQRFALALAEAGYTTFAHDHRGHGHTEANGASPGIFAKTDGWEKVMADVDAVNAEIRNLYPEIPIVCFGHSMGSIIAQNYAMRHPSKINALSAWNSGAETGALLSIYRTLLKSERFFKGSDVPSTIAPKLTFDAWNKEFSPARTEFDWLSRDGKEVDKYVADPLCGFPVTTGLWIGVTDGILFAADNNNLARLPGNLPVHLQAGAKDPCSLHGLAVENIESRMKNIGMTDVEFFLLKDTRHECLNEVNRDDTVGQYIQWLDMKFG